MRCALYLCSTSNVSSETVCPPGSIPCPLCRHGITSFAKFPGSSAKEIKVQMSLSLCTPCMLHQCDPDSQSPNYTPDFRKNSAVSLSSDVLCPVTCSSFPSVMIPLCTCDDGPFPSLETGDGEEARETSCHSQVILTEQDKEDRPRVD